MILQSVAIQPPPPPAISKLNVANIVHQRYDELAATWLLKNCVPGVK